MQEIRINATATTPKLLKESYKRHHIIAKRKGVLVYRGQIENAIPCSMTECV